MRLHGHLSVASGPTQATRAKGLWVVNLATVKSELGISDADTSYDAELNRLIAALSAAFAGPDGFNRPFQRQTYLERLPGFGGFRLPLQVAPVESVTSVTYGLGSSPDTVDASSYSIFEPDRDGLYAEEGWNTSGLSFPTRSQVAGDEALEYSVTYLGGWVMPPAISDWAAGTTYAVGDFVRASSPALLLFECTVGGVAHASTEPTWPTTAGDTVVDNAVTWTARDAREMPHDLQLAALITIKEWFEGGLDRPAGIKREGQDGFSVEYSESGQPFSLPPAARYILQGYRS